MKREKNNLEYEVTRHKSNTETERRKVEKLERDVAIAAEKAEKAQREVQLFLQLIFRQSTYFFCPSYVDCTFFKFGMSMIFEST